VKDKIVVPSLININYKVNEYVFIAYVLLYFMENTVSNAN